MKTKRVCRNIITKHKCFSRSGWWQTLCGLDAANQGFGWSTKKENVGCQECLKRIAAGEHIVNPPKRKPDKVYAGGTRRPLSIRNENQLFRPRKRPTP